VRISASRGEVLWVTETSKDDPGSIVVGFAVSKVDGWSFNNGLSLFAARRFSYCVHLGEAKHEVFRNVVPLLPLIFEALKSTVEDGDRDSAECTQEENAAKH
jgi:hypothetical protein